MDRMRKQGVCEPVAGRDANGAALRELQIFPFLNKGRKSRWLSALPSHLLTPCAPALRRALPPSHIRLSLGIHLPCTSASDWFPQFGPTHTARLLPAVFVRRCDEAAPNVASTVTVCKWLAIVLVI